MQRILLCLAVITFGMVPAYAGDAASDARKQIQAAYDRENAAAARKDTSGALANMTAEYVHTNSRGQTVTVEQLRQTLPRLFSAMMSLKGTTKITGFALKGSQADVQVKEYAVMMLMNPRTRKPSKLEVHDVSRSVWVKVGNVWKRKRSKTLTSTQTMDGKPLPQRM